MKLKFWFLFLMLILAGCATTPKHTHNACAVLKQKEGIFVNWHRSLKKAEREYGIPMPVIMATIYIESGFNQHAKPPRTKFLGFFPGKHASTAYGYAQALDKTWDEFAKSTNNRAASRTDFHDSARFIAWYHFHTVRNGITPNDSYNLYLNYHMGRTAYQQGRRSAAALRAAARMQSIAKQYDRQLRSCRMR